MPKYFFLLTFFIHFAYSGLSVFPFEYDESKLIKDELNYIEGFSFGKRSFYNLQDFLPHLVNTVEKRQGKKTIVNHFDHLTLGELNDSEVKNLASDFIHFEKFVINPTLKKNLYPENAPSKFMAAEPDPPSFDQEDTVGDYLRMLKFLTLTAKASGSAEFER